MDWIYARIATSYYVVATIFLMVLAFMLMLMAIWEIVHSFSAGNFVPAILSAISLLIIGFAVVETAKFIAEEEILRERELRSSTESRRSLTKFITIIVIAASLEALVMVFKANREAIHLAFYPAGLFMSAMFALLALGAYQWLSSRIVIADSLERNPEVGSDDAEVENGDES
jgi:uncharacterized membrane protein